MVSLKGMRTSAIWFCDDADSGEAMVLRNVSLLVAAASSLAFGGPAGGATIDALSGYRLNVTNDVGTSTALPSGFTFKMIAGAKATFTGIESVTNAQLVSLAMTDANQITVAVDEGTLFNSPDEPFNVTYTADGGGHLLSAAPSNDGANAYLVTLLDSGGLAAGAKVSAQWRMSQLGSTPAFQGPRPEEMPGWYIFYQVNGIAGTWNRLAGAESTHPATTTPPTVGTEPVATATLPVALGDGDVLNLLLFKDNGTPFSPDDNWGLSSLAVTPAPEPATLGLASVAAFGCLITRRRR